MCRCFTGGVDCEGLVWHIKDLVAVCYCFGGFVRVSVYFVAAHFLSWRSFQKPYVIFFLHRSFCSENIPVSGELWVIRTSTQPSIPAPFTLYSMDVIGEALWDLWSTVG